MTIIFTIYSIYLNPSNPDFVTEEDVDVICRMLKELKKKK